jgi:hypothetical protein
MSLAFTALEPFGAEVTADEVVGLPRGEGRALPFEPASPRVMHRTTLAGEEEVA